MVQVLHRTPQQPKRSFGNEILGTLDRASQMYTQHQGEKMRQMQTQQENEAAKNMGVDLSGISDPKIRQQAIQMSLQGANQRELENLKQLGKQGQIEQKQSFLDKLLSGEGQQQQNQQGQTGQPQDQRQVQGNQGFDPSKLTDAQIAQAAAVDPNLGRELRYAKDSSDRKRLAQEKLEFAKDKASPEYQRQQHLESSQAQADVKYNQQLQETSKQHELKERSLERLEKLNLKGVTGKPWEKLAEKSGLINITSEGRREFAAEVKSLITDIRSILGGQFSNFEFQTILNAYPSADFSKEANSAIIKNLKEFQDIKHKEVEFAQQLKKENDGKLPIDFQSKVNEKVREYTASRLPEIKENTSKILNEEYGIPKGFTLMFDQNDEPLSVPASEISKYLDLGASLP